ncbi:hypothetical protein RUND412_006161 [Rhizina undulata]
MTTTEDPTTKSPIAEPADLPTTDSTTIIPISEPANDTEEGKEASAPKTIYDVFPPVTKRHILNCSYPSWYSTYRSITPKARTVRLDPAFMSYLRADGIVLPSETPRITTLSDDDSGFLSESDDDDDEEDEDPSELFPEVHQKIQDTIQELGGKVAPKLNWSAPKDATFMSPTNSLECRSASEIYLLLKSSDFITHDLEHPFDHCVGDEKENDIDYHLVLRKWFDLNPSVEFRCFVKDRRLVAISQRDMNHYEFLFKMAEEVQTMILDFFETHLKNSFPDKDFVFDCYIPRSKEKVWLVDINPYAPRTDAVLYSWLEILQLELPPAGDDEDWKPELRLVKKDDPEAYSFATPQYSAHKLPKEVVDAGCAGEGAIWEFAQKWREIVEKEGAES